MRFKGCFVLGLSPLNIHVIAELFRAESCIVARSPLPLLYACMCICIYITQYVCMSVHNVITNCEGSGEGFARIAAIFAMESYLKMSSLHTPVNSISTPRV